MEEKIDNAANEITRRDALGLFKAMAILGAGLAISRNVFADQKDALPAIQSKFMPGQPGFFCNFYVINEKMSRQAGPQVFSVQLPNALIGLLHSEPRATVQIKFFMNQVKGESMSFGDGSVRVNQGMIQSKAFASQWKFDAIQQKGMIQDKLAPAPGMP